MGISVIIGILESFEGGKISLYGTFWTVFAERSQGLNLMESYLNGRSRGLTIGEKLSNTPRQPMWAPDKSVLWVKTLF